MKTFFTFTTMQRSLRVLALAVMLTCGLFAGTQPAHAATTTVHDWFIESPFTANTLEGVSCPSTTLCKGVGYSGTILSSNGTSWSADTSGTTSPFQSVACPSTMLCKAVGGGVIRSWNGTSWSVDTFSVTTLYGVACPDLNLCIAVGLGGSIRTWNGTSWSAQTVGTTTLRSVACPSTTLCKAVGLGGTILSRDGTSWSADTSGVTSDLDSVACPSTMLCKAVGASGTILSWNGSAWSADTSNTTNGLFGVACASPTLCKAVGNSATIGSWDGASWSMETFGVSNPIFAIVCLSTTQCKASQGGTILGMVAQTRNNVSAGLALDVTGSVGCLTGITITEFQSNHPNATSQLQNGRYWTITPAGCTSGFSATLTLPTTFTPTANSTLCRYLGSGLAWNCNTSSFTTTPNLTVTRATVTQFSDWAAGTSAPTSATLTKFGAKAKTGKTGKQVVRVKWETGSELQVVGFNLWRKKGNAQWIMHNAQLIAAQHAGEIVGGQYKFVDKKVKAGATYFYKLEIVRADGTSEWSEEEKVSVP